MLIHIYQYIVPVITSCDLIMQQQAHRPKDPQQLQQYQCQWLHLYTGKQTYKMIKLILQAKDYIYIHNESRYVELAVPLVILSSSAFLRLKACLQSGAIWHFHNQIYPVRCNLAPWENVILHYSWNIANTNLQTTVNKLPTSGVVPTSEVSYSQKIKLFPNLQWTGSTSQRSCKTRF